MTAQAIATYLSDAAESLPFCPGCGHSPLLAAVDAALVRLQLPPEKVVLVTDIGCIGLSDQYFITNAFHGLHGRSLTYASGIKLTRPELSVIVLLGDGGCGIGGTHLLNAARRNIDLTLIVANNFNYGMTGGQHSVTTPLERVTATTPAGNPEAPIDLCGAAIAAGGSWVYRGSVFDKDLPERIATAIRHPGFAMLDVWELCTAYFVPRNQFKKKDVYDQIARCGFSTGLLADKPRPEYGARYRELAAANASSHQETKKIDVVYRHNLDRQTGIVISGSAGEKIQSSATIFAKAAISTGLRATQKDDFPVTVMTGHSTAEIILSPREIDYTGIEVPNYVVVLSVDGLKRVREQIRRLPATSMVLADDAIELPETKAVVLRLPLLKTAGKIDRRSAVPLALSALLQKVALFDPQAYETATSAFQKPAVAALNLRALEAGSALVAQSNGVAL